MNLTEIRKLVSKLNAKEKIVGVWKMKKEEIKSELAKHSYQLDEVNKALVPVGRPRKKIIK